MGKASKWFRGLLGLKKPERQHPQPPPPDSTKAKPPKKKWSFVKSYNEKDQQPRGLAVADNEEDPARHAIAVAEATAAAAEVARAAAQAAAKMVRLTSSGRAISSNATNTARVTSFGTRNAVAVAVLPANVGAYGGGYGNRAEWAAVLIQSYFRAYLARRALRALKALVKLQAIVRGRIERRRNTACILQQMQMRELLRARTLGTSAGRAGLFESPHKANHIHYLGPATPEKFEHILRAKSTNHGENLMYRRNGSKKNKSGSNQNCRVAFKSWENEGSNGKTGSRCDAMTDNILEIDNGKPQVMPKRRNLFHSSHLNIGSDQYSHSFTTSKDSTAPQTVPSLSSFEVQSLMSPLQFSHDADEDLLCTAENSSQFHSVSSKADNPRRGPFTPTRSDGSRSCLSGYSDYPNYMSCTESSKAKIRSLSAPKQRPPYERSSSAKRFSIHGFYESRVNPQRVSTLHANFTSKAYPGSGRLDRLGMPVRAEADRFSGGPWHRV